MIVSVCELIWHFRTYPPFFTSLTFYQISTQIMNSAVNNELLLDSTLWINLRRCNLFW